MSTKEVELFRDSTHTPWGFRLVGGKDLKQALHVQKVSLCSPSHGEVEAGDVLLKVQGHDATEMTHAGAQDVIKKAGGSLKLTIRKHGYNQTSQTSQPQPWNQGSYMMNRLQGTLNGAITNKHHHPPSTYSAKSVLADFISHNNTALSPSPLKSPPELGWSPSKQAARNEMGTCFVPRHYTSREPFKPSSSHPSIDRPSHFATHTSLSDPPHYPWKFQNTSPQYPQSPYEPPHHSNGTSPLTPSNKQYNSPIGLYGHLNNLVSHSHSHSPSQRWQEGIGGGEGEGEGGDHEEVLYTHKVHH